MLSVTKKTQSQLSSWIYGKSMQKIKSETNEATVLPAISHQMRFSNFEGPFPVRLFPRGLVYVHAQHRNHRRHHGYPMLSVTKKNSKSAQLLDIWKKPRAELTLSFFLLQTTWGSRDGADDYDAERMKKRTKIKSETQIAGRSEIIGRIEK
jgi:hypothetical protein